MADIQFTEWTALVLMTHNYELTFLKDLLPAEPAYIGILGPKKKLERLLAELEEEGINVSATNLENIHGPVGLDIGSETAEEIALSINR